MALIYYLHAEVRRRISHVNRPENRDRGDGPVPTAIIIAGLVLLAAAVLTWAVGLVEGYMTTAPEIPTTGG
jgi:hypothetical protein